MREILFRGYSEAFGKWFYGHFSEYNGEFYINVKEEGIYHNYKVEEKSVGQFTGLKDKNGKDIYEGHIVNPMEKGFKQFPFVVEMLEGYWSVAPFKTDTALEIIGNVFDNPEEVKVE